MMRRVLFVHVMLALALLFCAEAACCGVVINELMPDPASDWSPTDGNEEYHSLEDEWIEIVNTGASPVDITGWRLKDAASDSSWRYGFSGVIGPGQFVVVYGNDSYDWEGENGFSRYGLSLNNSGDTVTLVASDLSTVMDQVTYESGDIGDDRAFGRVPDGDGDWCCIDGLNPADPPGSGTPPTPGMPNVGSPVESGTWGRLKSLYD
mgnify:CR=1 FL=1